MAGQVPNNAGNVTGQAQMNREWNREWNESMNQPYEFPSEAHATIHNQGQVHEIGNQVKNMTQGAADMGKGATHGIVNIARGAATGAANMAHGAADAVKNTFGMNSLASHNSGHNPAMATATNLSGSHRSMGGPNSQTNIDMEGLRYPSHRDSSANYPGNANNNPSNPNTRHM